MNSINKIVKKEVFVEKKKGKEIKEKDNSDIKIEEDEDDKVDAKEKGKKGENVDDEECNEKSR